MRFLVITVHDFLSLPGRDLITSTSGDSCFGSVIETKSPGRGGTPGVVNLTPKIVGKNGKLIMSGVLPRPGDLQ